MTRQQSDKGTVPEGLRKLAPTRESGGGRALAVKQETSSLTLKATTAEHPKGAVACADEGEPSSARDAAPKVASKRGASPSAMMNEIVIRLSSAFERVARNKGAPGPDRQTIGQVREHWSAILAKLSRELLSGHYRPGDVRRVWIPKAGGGRRGLGIPNVVDRVVQEALRQVLEPRYEPTFHDSSHGFRPGRSCHTAIAQATEYLEQGREWVVDIDLEKFFDRVCHQRLLARLSQRAVSKDVLSLIGKMLKAQVVLPEGVVVTTEEGLPQGGPLSPLLSNVVLDELDWELSRRGHSFVRYADDCNIYVRSERAGLRVMESVSRFLGKRMRLQVNVDKSAVARSGERHFLGFTVRREPLDGTIEIGLSQRTKKRVSARIVELTPRNWGNSLAACIQQTNQYLDGWLGFFGNCTAQELRTLSDWDAHIRRRLRAIQLKHWKRNRTIAHKLIAHGARSRTAWQTVYEGRKSLWKLSHAPVVNYVMDKLYFVRQGLLSLKALWETRHKSTLTVPKQLSLPWDSARP